MWQSDNDMLNTQKNMYSSINHYYIHIGGVIYSIEKNNLSYEINIVHLNFISYMNIILLDTNIYKYKYLLSILNNMFHFFKICFTFIGV